MMVITIPGRTSMTYLSVFDRPDFKEAERKEQEKQRAHLELHGYELINVSRPFPWVDEIETVRDIRPEYELCEIATGKRIGGMIDCNYWQAIRWAVEKVNELVAARPAPRS
jgi:hypothetical protein